MGMRGVSRPMAEQAMGSGHGEGGLNATLVGLAVVVLSVPRGPKTERYGAWDHYIR
jgi:hypothetical protein